MADYHAMLGGQGLVLDLQSYKRRVAPAWVAKDAAGDRQYSDAAFYQTWLTDDWSGGDLAFAGRREHDPEHPSRYRSGRGADGYSITAPSDLATTLAAAVANRRTAVIDVPMVNEPVPTPGHWKIKDIYQGLFE